DGEDQRRPQAMQGEVVHGGVPWCSGGRAGAARSGVGGRGGTERRRVGRQRQNSSKACPRRDGQNHSRSAAALRVDAPCRPPEVGSIEGSVRRTTPSWVHRSRTTTQRP